MQGAMPLAYSLIGLRDASAIALSRPPRYTYGSYVTGPNQVVGRSDVNIGLAGERDTCYAQAPFDRSGDHGTDRTFSLSVHVASPDLVMTVIRQLRSDEFMHVFSEEGGPYAQSQVYRNRWMEVSGLLSALARRYRC